MENEVARKGESQIEFWRRIGWERRLSEIIGWKYTVILDIEDFSIIHSGRSYIGVHKPCTYTFNNDSNGFFRPGDCFCDRGEVRIPNIISVTLRWLNL
jgi:hypothetical protein